MLALHKMITRPRSIKKKLLDKSQLPLIKITHRKLIIWYISNIWKHNFNIFLIKLRIIKIKINEFILSNIFNNSTRSSILIYKKYRLNNASWINLLLFKVLGKQGLWWKNNCLPVSIINDSFNRSNNSYRYVHRIIYNLLYIIKMKKVKHGQWGLIPQLKTDCYVNIILKLIFSAAIKDKKAGAGSSILKQYYNNLIQFKLIELKIINNYNLYNMTNKTKYYINNQIHSKIKKLKKKTLNTKIIKRKIKPTIFNNKLKLIEENILLIVELIKSYNIMIVIIKKLQYINKKWCGRLFNKWIFSNIVKTLPIYTQQSIKRFFDFKVNNINISQIQKLHHRLIKSGRKSLLIIIRLFWKNKKFKNIFKHFINKVKNKLLCKLSSVNRIICAINVALLSKRITTIVAELFNSDKRKRIISKLINKYKKSKIIGKKKIQKINILTYIYNKLGIISKKKETLMNKLRNKYKKGILMNGKIKNKIIFKLENKDKRIKILNNKIINNKSLINKVLKNQSNNKDKNNKIITWCKIKKLSNIKWKRIVIILGNKLKKKLISLQVIDIGKILRIMERFPRYSYKIYGIKRRPKKFTWQINQSKLFRIWNYESSLVKRSHHWQKKRVGVSARHKQYPIKKKIDIIAWRNRKHFSQKKNTRNLAQLLYRSTLLNLTKSGRKKWHTNFFLTSFGLSFITNTFYNKYMVALVAKAATTTLFKNNSYELDIMWIGYQINNQALGYLYLKTINSVQTSVWNYWSIYFLQRSIVSIYSRQLFYIVKDRKRFSPLKGYRNRMKLVCWKKGQTWINKLLLKRRLYSIRHWSIWKRRFPRKRLYKKYRNHKLPDKFYNNKFYINLWYTNYNIRSCRRILYKWRYRRNLVLKSLRFFYGQLNSRSIAKLLILVNRRVSIYNNKYDRFFGKLDNKLACQAYNFGLAQTSFWSNQFTKNGWLTVSNPDKDIMFLNYLLKIKKSIFPINLFDPKSIYWTKQKKSYKFEQYKYLMMPQRKQQFLLTAGDLINFIYSSETFSTKFNEGNTLRMNLPINKNILNGETYEYSVDNKFKVPTLIQREIYNTAVLLFDPRIQDLSISSRINAEKILFSIRNVK